VAEPPGAFDAALRAIARAPKAAVEARVRYVIALIWKPLTGNAVTIYPFFAKLYDCRKRNRVFIWKIRRLTAERPFYMGTHMKATIDIADNLLARAKAIAHRDQTTLRSLVEEGLDVVVQRRHQPAKQKIKFATFHGGARTEEFKNASWEQIRDEIYRGRGT
jgi:hypothetical protein